MSSMILNVAAQSDDVKFAFTVEYKNNEFKFKSHNGFAWKTLSYKVKENNPIYISYSGVSKIQDLSENSEILFSIQKTSKGMALAGIKGTKWKNLQFSCIKANCSQYIDQNGMVKD